MTNPGKKPSANGKAGIEPARKKRKDNETLEYAGIKLAVFPEVYFPHEDSFLLADAAREFSFGNVLDMGCGSGIAGISSSKNSRVSSITFADISKKAVQNADKNYRLNKIKKPVSFVQTNLFTALKNQKFDTILFNPPYLPTSKDEKLPDGLNSAFDGGKSGRKIIDKFLPQVGLHLSKNGILLYLDSSLTDTEKTLRWLGKNGFKHEKIASQHFFFEEISVLKITRS